MSLINKIREAYQSTITSTKNILVAGATVLSLGSACVENNYNPGDKYPSQPGANDNYAAPFTGSGPCGGSPLVGRYMWDIGFGSCSGGSIEPFNPQTCSAELNNSDEDEGVISITMKVNGPKLTFTLTYFDSIENQELTQVGSFNLVKLPGYDDCAEQPVDNGDTENRFCTDYTRCLLEENPNLFISQVVDIPQTTPVEGDRPVQPGEYVGLVLITDVPFDELPSDGYCINHPVVSNVILDPECYDKKGQ
ncbi:MAG TPA: hypothetical protein VJC39_02230 [Candidatus Nanoarchaeia archaeon]|nr:hypothetical protein [Candidatus Nanoarchaeia archaeon]